MKTLQLVILCSLLVCIAGCGAKTANLKPNVGKTYTVNGKTYSPLKTVTPGFAQQGIASWYGPGFHGKKTSSGEIYDMRSMTAAHNILPLQSVVKVTNLNNRKEVVVRINDRGPFVDDRVLDLSLSAAHQLDMVGPGTIPIKLTVISSPGSVIASKLPDPSLPVGQSPPSPNPFFSGNPFGLLAFLKN